MTTYESGNNKFKTDPGMCEKRLKLSMLTPQLPSNARHVIMPAAATIIDEGVLSHSQNSSDDVIEA